MADIEEVKEFCNNYEALNNGRKAMLKIFKGYRAFLGSFQKNNAANFYEGVEGTKEYRNMTGALSELIEKLEDKKTDPLVVKQALHNLYDTSKVYKDSKSKIRRWASDEGGRGKYAIAEAMTKMLPETLNAYDNLLRPFEKKTDKNGTSYDKLSVSKIEAKAKKYLEKYGDDLEDEGEWKKEPDFSSVKKISGAQVKLLKKIGKISKTLALKYNHEAEDDYYLTIKKKMSIEDKAKYYLGKKYLDKAYAPGIDSVQAQTILDDFNSKDFKSEYMALAKNVYFVNCMKENPADGFSKWREREESTDMNIRNFQEELGDLGLKQFAPGIINQNIGQSVMGFKPNPEKIAARRKEICNDIVKAMTLDILVDPEHRNLAREITLHPENREKFEKKVAEKLAEKNIFSKDSVDSVTNKAADFMKNPENRKSLVNDFVKNMTAERLAARKKTAERKQG